MARARDKVQWNHTAALIATLSNIHTPKNQRKISPDEVNPYSSKTGGNGSHKIKLTRDNLHVLKHAVAGFRGRR